MCCSRDVKQVLFLDMDGVLVTDLSRWRPAEGWSPARHEPTPVNIAALNKIVDATGVRAVISSSWRRYFDWPEMQVILADAGCVIEVIGETPLLEELKASGLWGARRRIDEIKEWLALNPDKWDRYVVVDDDPDAGKPDAPWFFQTEFSQGLTREMADEIIVYLQAP